MNTYNCKERQAASANQEKRREKIKQIDVACLFIDFRDLSEGKGRKKKSENRHRLSRLILPTKTTAFLWLFGTSFTRRTNGNYSGMPKSVCCWPNIFVCYFEPSFECISP